MNAAAIDGLLVGESAEIRELRELIAKFAPTNLAVWVEGETGCGKEQAAMALHASSGRSGAFVPVNVSAVPDSMFEATFFGHMRGAFTGAHETTIGLFEEAHRGTLFLDEVSALPLHSQAKLLRAVETRRFRPVGGRGDRSCDVRVVAASNEPHADLLSSRRLRPDFAFRLRGGVLQIPPLRRRPQDVGPLVRHFMSSSDPAGTVSVDPLAIEWLKSRTWLGNVRELRQVVDCARALSSRQHIALSSVQRAARMLGADHVSAAPREVGGRRREELLSLLVNCEWNTQRVARCLDVDRTTVYRRMRKYGIDLQRMQRSSQMEPRRVASAS